MQVSGNKRLIQGTGNSNYIVKFTGHRNRFFRRQHGNQIFNALIQRINLKINSLFAGKSNGSLGYPAFPALTLQAEAVQLQTGQSARQQAREAVKWNPQQLTPNA